MLLPLILGKKLNGEELIADLTKLPHLLICGLSGYGKSNLIINLVDELAARKSPEEVKFLLIDPKMVEFTSLAERIKDYLFDRVYTDIYGAYDAISTLCEEMGRRYALLREKRCRSIVELNADNEIKLPYIVLVIDEYADLFLCSSQSDDILGQDEEEDEEGVFETDGRSDDDDTFITDITRLGMVGRAVGIHVIISTQRPSTEIVQSVIKANYPARISFKVRNSQESEIILDKYGAENLQSPGDFIWCTNGNFEFAHSPLSKDN